MCCNSVRPVEWSSSGGRSRIHGITAATSDVVDLKHTHSINVLVTVFVSEYAELISHFVHTRAHTNTPHKTPPLVSQYWRAIDPLVNHRPIASPPPPSPPPRACFSLIPHAHTCAACFSVALRAGFTRASFTVVVGVATHTHAHTHARDSTRVRE